MAKKHLANQAKKAAFALIAIMKTLNHPPIPVMLKLYESMIKPIMCYGSEIWGFKEDKELERIEKSLTCTLSNTSWTLPYPRPALCRRILFSNNSLTVSVQWVNAHQFTWHIKWYNNQNFVMVSNDKITITTSVHNTLPPLTRHGQPRSDTGKCSSSIIFKFIHTGHPASVCLLCCNTLRTSSRLLMVLCVPISSNRFVV